MLRYLPIATWLIALFTICASVLLILCGTIYDGSNGGYSSPNHHFLQWIPIWSLTVTITSTDNTTDPPTPGLPFYPVVNWTCFLYMNALCNTHPARSPSDPEYFTCDIGAGEELQIKRRLEQDEIEVFFLWDSTFGTSGTPESEPESGSETTSVVSRGDPKWGWVGARQASRTPTPSSNAVVTETDLIIVTGQTPSPTAPSSASTTSSYPIVTGIPYVASSHLGIGRISYVVPFVFYIMAIINASVLLLTLLGTFRGYSRRSFLNFSIAGVSALFIFRAISLVDLSFPYK